MASDLVSNESMWYGANLFSFKIRTSFLLLNEFTSGEIVDRMLGIRMDIDRLHSSGKGPFSGDLNPLNRSQDI